MEESSCTSFIEFRNSAKEEEKPRRTCPFSVNRTFLNCAIHRLIQSIKYKLQYTSQSWPPSKKTWTIAWKSEIQKMWCSEEKVLLNKETGWWKGWVVCDKITSNTSFEERGKTWGSNKKIREDLQSRSNQAWNRKLISSSYGSTAFLTKIEVEAGIEESKKIRLEGVGWFES